MLGLSWPWRGESALALPSSRANASRPYTRWWWFSQPIEFDAIRSQLDWLARNGFGGVEIAWIYPLDAAKRGVPWLGPEWTALVTRAKKYATDLGLGCDFTFGSMWPFGGSFVEPADAAKTFDGLCADRLTENWEPAGGYIIDHLSSRALRNYARKMGEALKPAIALGPTSLFCDSLEINTATLWSDGLWDAFHSRMGYDLRPYAKTLDTMPDVRYDYRKFVGEIFQREFFDTFTAVCHELGARSRVQCQGAPVDLLTAYASVDIPESEAILFNPGFSRLAASAAAWSGKPVVSAETFTCLYGFPKAHHREEKLGDLKALVDTLFANGVNHCIYHGMPFNPPGARQEFYATVHVGPDAGFAAGLPRLNRYVETLATAMRAGETLKQVAVYLPNEDYRRLGDLPPALQTPGAGYYWEMRTVELPEETRPYAPVWISPTFLDREFAALYIDVEFLDGEALAKIVERVRQGRKVVLKREPKYPGKLVPPDFAALLAELKAKSYPSLESSGVVPLLSGEDLPHYWAKETADGAWWFFFAHPGSRKLVYPMPYGFAETLTPTTRELTIRHPGGERRARLQFGAGEAILLRVDKGGARRVPLPW